MPEMGTSGLMSGDGKRGGARRQYPRPSSTLPGFSQAHVNEEQILAVMALGPVGAVQTPVLHRLGEVLGRHCVRLVHIGDGASQLEDAIVGPG